MISANPIPLVLALLGGVDPLPEPARQATPLEVVSAFETVLSDAIDKTEASVVAVARMRSENEATTAVRGRNPAPVTEAFGPDQISFDYGSGVVIGDKGEILTAFHVVKGASRLTVRAQGGQAFDAEVLAADPRSDLAVIAPREGGGAPAPKLVPLAIGDASKLRKGAFLLALGNPFNAAGQDGRPSASWGILANVARRLEMMGEHQQLQLKNYPTLLQLDSKLNLGMSGGAVINLKGELVGLTTNSANAAGFDAQAGYAIPMDALGRRAVETLRRGKEVEYGFLGIRLDTQNRSNRVISAEPGTPAGVGGVRVDDVILGVGNLAVTDIDSLVLAINNVPAGTPVTLKILRRNEVIERTVELAKVRIDGEVIATNRPPSWRGLRVDYTSTMPQSLPGPDLGALVVEVEGNSPAEKAGLKAGLVIKSVEGRVVRNPREFSSAVADRAGPVNLTTDHGPATVK